MRKIICIASSLFLFFSITSGQENQYTEHSLARLSHTTGNTFIQKAGDLAYEEGVVNMPVAEGDRINTTEGRAEIYLGNSHYVRIDFNTKIDFTKLPSIESDLIQLKLWTGDVMISIGPSYKEKSIELHTGDISVYILDQGLYRLNVRENENTEFFVYEGVAEAAGESESVLLKNGQKLEAQRGFYTEHTREFSASANDSFYEWSVERDSILQKHFAERHLPEKLDDFEYELNTYGHWNYQNPYGYVWVPTGISPNWRPYYNGRWLWYPICGWTWLPYEPWGWVTFHYGRWHWSIDLGWYWIPTTRWGPAWVRWYRWNDYWAWTPISYYNYPVVIINNVFYPRYNRNTYPHNSRALTVVHKDQLRARNLHKAALNQHSLTDLQNAELYRSTPSVKEFPKSISIKKLDTRKVLLHHSGDEISINNSRNLKTRLKEPENMSDIRSFPENQRKLRKPNKERVISREFGYPSSLRQKIDKYINHKTDKDTKSIVGRALNYFSSGKSQYIKTRTDPYKGETSSRKITSFPHKRTSSSITRTIKSISRTKISPKSRVKKSSGSKKVKKKK